MNFEAVIFDMDGVLVDSEPFYYARRQAFFASESLDLTHFPPSFFIGGNMKNLWDAMLGGSVSSDEKRQLQQRYETYRQTHPLPYQDLLMPGAADLLAHLARAGVKIGLASSSTKADILQALSVNQLTAYFDVILSGEAFRRTKPDPEIYATACARLSVEARRALVIEDSTVGITAGKAAGATVWAVAPSTAELQAEIDQTGADRTFVSLTEIEKALT